MATKSGTIYFKAPVPDPLPIPPLTPRYAPPKEADMEPINSRNGTIFRTIPTVESEISARYVAVQEYAVEAVNPVRLTKVLAVFKEAPAVASDADPPEGVQLTDISVVEALQCGLAKVTSPVPVPLEVNVPVLDAVSELAELVGTAIMTTANRPTMVARTKPNTPFIFFLLISEKRLFL